MVFKRRCVICRSKKWHKDPSSGMITCSEGHVLEGYRNETTEGKEFGPHAMRKRTLKSGRIRVEKTTRADPNLYHGKRAQHHYYQCLQVLLRLQVRTLMKIWQLPAEFETICRDIWALHLSLLQSPPSGEPYLYALDNANGQQPRTGDVGADTGDERRPDGGDESDDSQSGSSSSGSSLASEEDDVDMVELMRENSETGDSDDEDRVLTSGNKVNTNERKGGKRRRRGAGDNTCIGNIAVLVLACLMLRIPVIYMDFVKLINSFYLPYLDGVRHLPPSLTIHLTKHTKHSLSPHFAPSVNSLHTITSRISRALHKEYGVFTPSLNTAPVLWRLVKRMGGNAVLFEISKALAGFLDIRLAHFPTATPLMTMSSRTAKTRKGDGEAAEVMLAATVVICLKLIYGGFEGNDAWSVGGWDPASVMPRVESYLAQLREAEATETEQEGNGITPRMEGSTVENMDKATVDEYISFCERALLGGHVAGRGRNDVQDRSIEEHFALRNCRYEDEGDREGYKSREKGVVPTIEVKKDGGQQAQGYAIYSRQDVLGALPEQLAIVVGSAARWAGVDEDEMCGMIERLERRAVRRWKVEKRKGGINEDEEDRTDGDNDSNYDDEEERSHDV